MREISAILTGLALAALWAGAEELRTFSLDDATSVSPRIEADAGVKVEGKGSIKITTRWPTTVCLGDVSGLDIENAALVYTARVKAQLEGTAFLEMWAHVGGGRYFSKGMDNPVKGKSDWRSLQTRFVFQKGQKPQKVTLNLVIDGKGIVWIDDIVLSKEPLT